MSISIWIVFIEVYFNYPLESLKSDKKCSSYGIFMPTSRFTDVTAEQFAILIFQCLVHIFDTSSLCSFKSKVIRVLFQLESPNSEHRNSSYVQNNSDYSMIKTEIRISLAHGLTLSEFFSQLEQTFENFYFYMLVLLEVYFNWPLESLKSDKKFASYGIFMPTSRFSDVTEEQFAIFIFQCLFSIFGTGSLCSFKAKVIRVLFQLESPNSEHRNSSYVQNNSDYSMIKTEIRIWLAHGPTLS